MSARDLSEPRRAGLQMLERLRTGQARSENRQQWAGAIQRTTTEGVAAVVSNNTRVTLSAINVDPGTWAVFGRAGVQISSTPGVPTFTGREIFTVRLNVLDRETQAFREELDFDTWSPAVESDAYAGGSYAHSVMLFGSMTYETPTTIVVVGSADELYGADHIIPWRAGKLMALPF